MSKFRWRQDDWSWKPPGEAEAPHAPDRRMWWEKPHFSPDVLYSWLQDGGELGTKLTDYFACTEGVYAVQPTGGGPIKIGVTDKIATKRFDTIATSCPTGITVLGLGVGTRADEQRLHHELADFRLRREWFQDVPQVRRSFVAFVQDRGGVWCKTGLRVENYR